MNSNDNIVAREYTFGFHNPERSVFRVPKGLNAETVRAISRHKKEPKWMLNYRLQALEAFQCMPLPKWGPDLSGIDFSAIRYYSSPSDKPVDAWGDLLPEIRETYNRIGIPEAEQKYLAGVGAQYDSDVVYQRLKEEWETQGVIFTDTDSALRDYPELFREYFGSLVGLDDNKFAALNSAVWSGGSFVYVPKGVKVDLPLQAYFRINSANLGQFERTLIIIDEDSYVNYIEGCTAPIYDSNSLHAAVVEIIVKPRARLRYTTIQNWSDNVYNLVTKRMSVDEDAVGEWVDGNIGSKTTMKYPAVILKGTRARGEILSLAWAGTDQCQDTGGKAVHLAPNTTSVITAKSVCAKNGRSSYRGLVKIISGAHGSRSFIRCDALLLDANSRSDTYPTNIVEEEDVSLGHEASVNKVGEEQLFYLMSRGLDEAEATSLIVNGFIEPIVRELPLEYAVELNRLISMNMEGSVG